jgi:hypothetical protein
VLSFSWTKRPYNGSLRRDARDMRDSRAVLAREEVTGVSRHSASFAQYPLGRLFAVLASRFATAGDPDRRVFAGAHILRTGRVLRDNSVISNFFGSRD